MFWIFSDPFSFVGFITQILYILTPIAFVIQLKNNVLNHERVSIFGLLCMYCNAYIYFITSAYKVEEGAEINPLDFCNLAGFYMGFVYLIIYLYFVHFKKNKKLGIIYMAILVVVSIAVWILIKYTVESGNTWDKIYNWMGVVFNVLEYFPIGFSMLYIIRHKVSEKYSLFGAFFGFLNCAAWFSWATYSVVVNDADLLHSIVANSLGICLVITQFVLFFVFRKESDEDCKSVGEKPTDIDIEEEEQKEQPEYMKEFI